jgi:hypothetical protein
MLSLACALRFLALPHLVVYPDDEDPQRYHLVTTKAHLSRRSDGVASFSIVSAGSGGPGFVSLTAELGPDGKDDAALRALLADPDLRRARMRPSDPSGNARRGSRPVAVPAVEARADASLVPPLFTEGQAALVIGDPGAPLIDVVQQPSLFGSNNASFSLLLEKGTPRLAEIVAAEGPIGLLTYRLTFSARVPALHVTLEARGQGPKQGETIEAAIARGALELTAVDANHAPAQTAIRSVVLGLAAELWRLRPAGMQSVSVAPGEIVTCHLVVTTTVRDLVPSVLWEGLR